MSENFQENLESLFEKRGTLLGTYRAEFLAKRVELETKIIYKCGAPLDSCFEFIDFTNIQNCRREWFIAANFALETQALSFSYTPNYHHTRITARLHVRSWRSSSSWLDLYKESGLEEVLEAVMVLNGKQNCTYSDALYLLQPPFETTCKYTEWEQPWLISHSAERLVRFLRQWSRHTKTWSCYERQTLSVNSIFSILYGFSVQSLCFSLKLSRFSLPLWSDNDPFQF